MRYPVELDSGIDTIQIGDETAAVQYTINDIPICDIECIYSAGTFKIIIS